LERKLQLIEIIQLALLLFIALGVIIFLFSYLGYRTKSKIKEFPKANSEVDKEDVQELNVVEDLLKNNEKVKPQESIKQNPRFEVFNPASEDKTKTESKRQNQNKSHSPKTLIIKHKP